VSARRWPPLLLAAAFLVAPARAQATHAEKDCGVSGPHFAAIDCPAGTYPHCWCEARGVWGKAKCACDPSPPRRGVPMPKIATPYCVPPCGAGDECFNCSGRIGEGQCAAKGSQCCGNSPHPCAPEQACFDCGAGMCGAPGSECCVDRKELCPPHTTCVGAGSCMPN